MNVRFSTPSSPHTPTNAPAHALDTPVLSVRRLAVSFRARARSAVVAVRDASLTLYAGQMVAIVGESGSGKSVTALSILRLLPEPPAHIDRGEVMFRPPRAGAEHANLLRLDAAGLRRVRGREIAMIFQEPMTCLNPVLSVGEQIMEAIRLHRAVSERDARERAAGALAEVGISEPGRRLRQFPHELSGGMRQRVMLAMALSCEPAVLIADEPTTALDASTQRQILDLIDGLRARRRLAVLFITHDLSIAAGRADVVCVMNAGRVLEYAASRDAFTHPLHPYTRALLASVPRVGERRERLAPVAEALSAAAMQEARRELDAEPWFAGASAGEDGGADGLVEVRPRRWVRLVTAPVDAPPPDLPDRAAALGTTLDRA